MWLLTNVLASTIFVINHNTKFKKRFMLIEQRIGEGMALKGRFLPNSWAIWADEDPRENSRRFEVLLLHTPFQMALHCYYPSAENNFPSCWHVCIRQCTNSRRGMNLKINIQRWNCFIFYVHRMFIQHRVTAATRSKSTYNN